MPSPWLWGALALLTYFVTTTLISWRGHIAKAKASGLPYIVVPVFIFSRPWLLVSRLFLPSLSNIPARYRPIWVDQIAPNHSWDQLFTPFEHNELGTYLTVSPGGTMLWTANADVISQVTSRRTDFPKPSKMYGSLNIFGPNIVSAEGQLWRRHRKITSPPFNERNNHLVWSESLRQGDSMTKAWTGMDGNTSRTVTTVAHDSMRLSLHIISRAGFGVRLLWPGIDTAQEKDAIGHGLSEGHTMTYTEALSTLLHSVLLVVGLPHPLLRVLPFEMPKRAWESFNEWGKYMKEMMEAKKVEISSGEDQEGLDLMGALIRSAGFGAGSNLEKDQGDLLSDEEIMGNAFVFILAGHETTGNTIHFSLAFLAMHLASQRHLQSDLDQIFQGRKPSEWDYDKDLPRLFGGMTGAVMNETLRLIPPAINVPKISPEDQPLQINGEEYTVPAGTVVNLTTVAVHRNPRFWPTTKPSDPDGPWHPFSNHNDDLNEFKPERWLLNDDAAHKSQSDMPADAGKTNETEDLGINTAADTAASLYKPMKGAYVPFSEGYRSCIGRRFAQVEVLAVLALVLSQWSVELAVDQWASDEEVARMTESEKEALWRKARRTARDTMRITMGTVITLQLRNGAYVPLRFVRRGKERFNF